MKPVYAALRKKVIINYGYIDDSLLLADTKQEYEQNVQDTVSVLEEVEFIIQIICQYFSQFRTSFFLENTLTLKEWLYIFLYIWEER